MRLSEEQRQRIQQLVQAHLGGGVAVSVFGSRVDDRRRGGDLDLFIEADRTVSLLRRAALKMALEESLRLPVDLVIAEAGKPLSSFQSLAKARARPLLEAS
ncbi:nucleotidyltransferase domain-containing protein [Alloalcanivorax profundimaris]|uniref:nucleotidyltransferase domain-containing protein n=1 Tax=Alloalcanivorax profundimaris TaxID=2735259 RepID=UPI00188834D1|nr:nucleotidyltransferase domain-containing protein [Alloalcanivorax profundimaris]MBF1801825.1 nucleotidyltransferase domain-containing protein [Alloalcanivorax profundimaris]MCQ6262004.1 nucleotidyltransferase domain-containing protein [Alcanivorax sp. MM125-6]